MDLIPAPLSVTRPETGEFALDAGTPLTAEPGLEGVEFWLRAALGAATGLPLRPGPGGIELRLDGSLAPEEYRLSVGADGARLAAGAPAGAFRAAQTLRQLLGPDAYRRAPVRRTGWALPYVEIADAPRFGWRGALLDVSRHFLPKADVLRFLDLIAAHKLNVLHLHLTDDQGWRIEIERYPRLTEVASWRDRSMVGFRDAQRHDERPHGGFYTQDDLREIVAYADARHITVVPEIDLPGHSQAAISAYPELGNTDVVDTAELSVWTDWGVSANILNPSEQTLRFYEGVLEEVLAIFPSEFVHLGGDECPKDQWRASPAVQARIKELGLADEDELQSWFIRHFDRWLADRGRRLIGWDEILEGGLAPGAAVSSWRGYEGGVAAAKAGHDVVMCPEQHVYLDHRQGPGEDEPIPVGFVRSLEDVYRFEPVPPELSALDDDGAAAARVIGTQANLWTEFADDARDVDFRTFPRLAAFAEVAWSDLPRDPAARDWADFERRMTTHYARLDALGVEYRPADGPLPWQRRPGVLGRPKEGPGNLLTRSVRQQQVKIRSGPTGSDRSLPGFVRDSPRLSVPREMITKLCVPELPNPPRSPVPYGPGRTAGRRRAVDEQVEHGGFLVNRTIMLPASLDEAVEALAATPGAVPVAGATDLMEAVNAGRLRPAALIGLGRITELRGWRYEDGGTAVLGAGLTHARMDRPDFAALIPALADAARTAGPPQIRNVGTLGGNIATAAPAGDTLPVLAALEATVTLARAGSTREVPVSHLLTGLDPVRPGELLTWVRVPLLHAPQVFLKATGRSGPSRATASVALVLDPARRAVRCAVGAVAPVPLRPLEAESWVAGCIDWDARGDQAASAIDPAAAAAFGEYVAAACVPDGMTESGPGGAHAAASRLRRTVAVLARRALGRALK